MKASDIHDLMYSMKNPEQETNLLRFFKTGPGEYGEGDQFLGLKVPQVRQIAKKCSDVTINEVIKLLHSPFHEERLLSLFLLTKKFEKGDDIQKSNIYNLYLQNTSFINNWDLVDLSADKIIGAWLFNKDKSILNELATSDDLWKRRIAIMTTFYFIKNGEFNKTLELAFLLLNDKEDLIHKAVGWMLRETGKRDFDTEFKFLKKHYNRMPRTMLRYAIERFPEEMSQQFLKGKI